MDSKTLVSCFQLFVWHYNVRGDDCNVMCIRKSKETSKTYLLLMFCVSLKCNGSMKSVRSQKQLCMNAYGIRANTPESGMNLGTRSICIMYISHVYFLHDRVSLWQWFHRALWVMTCHVYYCLGDSGFEDDDFGGAISEEMLQVWVRELLINNSESAIDMDKVCHIVDTVMCARCRSERSRKPSKRFLKACVSRRESSTGDFDAERLWLERSPSGASGWHRSRHKRDSQQTDCSYLDSGLGSDISFCDLSSNDEGEDLFPAASRDDVCDVEATRAQFKQPLCVVVLPRRPRDYSRGRRGRKPPPCVWTKQQGKRSSSCTSPVVG